MLYVQKDYINKALIFDQAQKKHKIVVIFNLIQGQQTMAKFGLPSIFIQPIRAK